MAHTKEQYQAMSPEQRVEAGRRDHAEWFNRLARKREKGCSRACSSCIHGGGGCDANLSKSPGWFAEQYDRNKV